MTAWATIRRVGTGAALPLLLVLVGPLSAAPEPTRFTQERFEKPAKPEKPARPTPAQLRAAAEAAEKAGDWEAAFTAYCHLFVADRAAPDVREKLNTALRRTQQLRRHRDPQFQQYAETISVTDALNLFAEVFTKVPVLYAERERATPQLLWENGVEE